MDLFYRETGQGEPLIIIHGLYGCSDNWMTIARKLAEKFHVYSIDLRNHGQSPNLPTHTYDDMVSDLDQFLKKQQLNNVRLLGHSMGGKVAMRYTLDHPQVVKQLIVADIAPKNYIHLHHRGESANQHQLILETLSSIDLSTVKTRKDVDALLKPNIPELSLRQFLIKNIKKGTDNHYEWTINVDVLKYALSEIMGGFDNITKSAQTDSLFVRGENSPYVKAEDSFSIHNYFPNSNIVSIPDAGHWLHAEQPELFFNTIMYFLE